MHRNGGFALGKSKPRARFSLSSEKAHRRGESLLLTYRSVSDFQIPVSPKADLCMIVGAATKTSCAIGLAFGSFSG